jgi:hypothetical protein
LIAIKTKIKRGVPRPHGIALEGSPLAHRTTASQPRCYRRGGGGSTDGWRTYSRLDSNKEGSTVIKRRLDSNREGLILMKRRIDSNNEEGLTVIKKRLDSNKEKKMKIGVPDAEVGGVVDVRVGVERAAERVQHVVPLLAPLVPRPLLRSLDFKSIIV